jgi:hypothetical protein
MPLTTRHPSPEDIAAATAFIDGWPQRDPTLCPLWLARHRDSLIRSQAVAEMQVREHAEWRARTMAPQLGIAA